MELEIRPFRTKEEYGQKVYCEPYAENPAPNKVLSKLGFTLVKTYKTIPGKTCFEQNVNRWEILRTSAAATF